MDEAAREKAKAELSMLRSFSAAISGGDRYQELNQELSEISDL